MPGTMVGVDICHHLTCYWLCIVIGMPASNALKSIASPICSSQLVNVENGKAYLHASSLTESVSSRPLPK